MGLALISSVFFVVLGDGRIFVSGHGCYLDWLETREQTTDVKMKFMRRVREWLTANNRILGPDTDNDDSKIGDFNEIVSGGKPFENFRIVKCSSDFNADPNTTQSLLGYVENGGFFYIFDKLVFFLLIHVSTGWKILFVVFRSKFISAI
jgi:hypothetical protein